MPSSRLGSDCKRLANSLRDPACNVTYRAKVTSAANEDSVRALIQHTDVMAVIHNTLRIGTPVTLSQQEVVRD
jgi:hypothetical protein